MKFVKKILRINSIPRSEERRLRGYFEIAFSKMEERWYEGFQVANVMRELEDQVAAQVWEKISTEVMRDGTLVKEVSDRIFSSLNVENALLEITKQKIRESVAGATGSPKPEPLDVFQVQRTILPQGTKVISP